MKNTKNGNSGALYRAIMTVLTFGFALFWGCAGEADKELDGVNNETPISGLEPWVEPDGEFQPGNFPGLDARKERRIIQDYLSYQNSGRSPDMCLTEEDVFFAGYYGTYNGNVAVLMSFSGQMVLIAQTGMYVAGYDFPRRPWQILIWAPGKQPERDGFLNIPDAYDSGLLTMEDLPNLHEQYKELFREDVKRLEKWRYTPYDGLEGHSLILMNSGNNGL